MLGKPGVSPVVRVIEPLDPGSVPASRCAATSELALVAKPSLKSCVFHNTEGIFTLDSWQANPVWLALEWLLAAILEGGQFAPIGEGLRDDAGLMRGGRKGAGKTAAEADYNNPDAWFHG